MENNCKLLAIMVITIGFCCVPMYGLNQRIDSLEKQNTELSESIDCLMDDILSVKKNVQKFDDSTVLTKEDIDWAINNNKNLIEMVDMFSGHINQNQKDIFQNRKYIKMYLDNKY